ncbi:hypothetical protein FYZ48_21275 [Gimesia chilikensis]|uniref:hypothetical protein n=1 Tax=Gimesia chilikensis TaxID=2605989 RepID=UPI0011EFD43E|nr:hypothetical protein [Gimesia chilikensis]KAA0134126.1 hypothetical protein FYZ48_21275 [Gimesia chilikensis]
MTELEPVKSHLIGLAQEINDQYKGRINALTKLAESFGYTKDEILNASSSSAVSEPSLRRVIMLKPADKDEKETAKPTALADAVRMVLRESPKPLGLSEVARLVEQVYDTGKASREIRSSVSATLSNLKKQGELLHNAEEATYEIANPLDSLSADRA